MLRSGTPTAVNASGLFKYIIWSNSVAEAGVIPVGDLTSCVRPSSVIESQEEYGFSRSVLKSPDKGMSALCFTARGLSIIFTKSSNHS